MLTEVFGVTKLQAGGVLEAEVSTAGVKSVEWANWSPNTFALNGTDGRLAVIMLPYSVGRKNVKLRSKSIITNQTLSLESSYTAISQFFRTEMSEETGPEYVQMFSAPYTALAPGSSAIGTVSLTGNMPPLDSVTPKLLATIPYTDFTTASSSIYPYYLSSLTRSARQRTFMIYNTMNQPLTSNALAFYDSVLGITGQPGIAQTAVFTAAGSNAVSTVTSESASASSQGLVASHVDSFQAVLGIGATLPTSGNVYIYGSELL